MGMLVITSCTKYPPETDRLLQDLAIVTRYDTKVNFNNYKTFAIVSSISKITDTDTTQLTNSTAVAILDQITRDMESRGFTKVSGTATPDLGIDVLYYQNTTIYAYYGGWWYGYYPYYYGYYYPYYPVYYSSYTSGMANIELIDLKYLNTTTKQFYIRWNALIRGLVTGEHSTSEITAAVDQAFAQTPQLVTTSK